MGCTNRQRPGVVHRPRRRLAGQLNERRCVAAVQRDELTYVEVYRLECRRRSVASLTNDQVLDFGAAQDNLATDQLGKRILLNDEPEFTMMDEGI